MRDTSSKVQQVYFKTLREMPAWKKFRLIDGLNSSIREISLAGLRTRHPEFSEPEILKAAAALWLGRELSDKAYKNI
ncbi:MAG: hypothetical protein A2X34_02050 [Elusimicrobia bacterium GWC2_51_8]|nr:MAG: hypothetical protein A2X33_01380 [Elusimicrobia bacterium GWA2_51_34]OGR59204.1 MAG: hypothetical protein A2X34_02050 [Elusimicrobia bacterium GWC2_51_8]OGR86400.1 MAG: hypothetical protein A2021_07295 [Elusimicrobia bacterium GWF2_52_66]HAF96179.1 hypothetical protein [Elusimicrobiota bacterium]HCE97790.1 hypothetical protein [Elusimicrobiota bacterium]